MQFPYLPFSNKNASLPPLRSLSQLAIGTVGAVQQLFAAPPDVSTVASELAACSHPQLSCHNASAVENACCFNTPGGQLLLTQFWDTDPATGPDKHWTLHGLWPDHCDGSFDQFCDASRRYTNITAILQSYGETELLEYMNTYWQDYQGKNEQFWSHEWDKHGTCISTLDPACYKEAYRPQLEVVNFFNKAVELFKTLDSYAFLAEAGITPSKTHRYTRAAIEAALRVPRGVDATIQCRGRHRNELDEIWYHFNVRGSLQTGNFEPAPPDGAKSSCPDAILYLPKKDPSHTTATATTATTSSSDSNPTAPSFIGQGHLNVIPASSRTKHGCIISYGTWYASGTCAIFTACNNTDANVDTNTNSSLALKGSKGYCQVSNAGVFNCEHDSAAANSGFGHEDGLLSFNGSTIFYAVQAPRGTVQELVYAVEEAVAFSIEWRVV